VPRPIRHTDKLGRKPIWQLWSRVARWYVFKPKIQIWVIILGPRHEKGWYILLWFVVYYSHFVYFKAIL
jgi:hypothetical protein